MPKSAQLRARNAEEHESNALRSLQIAAEVDRRDVEAHVAELHARILSERRAASYRNLMNLWPVAVGLGLSFYAPTLYEMAAGYTPWAAKLLFSFSALVGQHEVRLGRALPSLSQVMLYAQFPLDGLLASGRLRKGSHVLIVCGQVILFHGVILLCIALGNGAFSGILRN